MSNNDISNDEKRRNEKYVIENKKVSMASKWRRRENVANESVMKEEGEEMTEISNQY